MAKITKERVLEIHMDIINEFLNTDPTEEGRVRTSDVIKCLAEISKLENFYDNDEQGNHQQEIYFDI